MEIPSFHSLEIGFYSKRQDALALQGLKRVTLSMKKLLFMTAFFASSVLAAPEIAPVFTAGQDGFPSVRIPSIVVTKSGALLAFAEGRKNLGDQAENKIIQKRSLDGGKTWLPVQVLADDGKRPLNNPCAVVEGKSGRVLLMFQSYPESLKEASGQIKTGYEGDDIVKSYLMHSDDEGQTWSALQEVTRQVKRAEKATTIASGPGIGIQLQTRRARGPFNYAVQRRAVWQMERLCGFQR